MKNNLSLKGQVALITGASSGLGVSFAQFLSKAGATVVLAARRRDKCAEVARKIDGKTLAVTLDVTDSKSIEDALSLTEKAFAPVSILVNSAGIVIDQPLMDTAEADWKHVIDTNLTGCWLMTQAVSRRMISENIQGRIVNISSILGFTPTNHVHAYSASKAGINQLTRTSAIELSRYGISVNAIAPGYIETDLNREFLNSPKGKLITKRIPQRRFGQLGDLEGPIILLTSPSGAYITGEIITIDGGLSLKGM
tara:strand:- start:397 stop:1155 length:759 start_codon:yes stop_codon:yes gene_type:complete